MSFLYFYIWESTFGDPILRRAQSVNINTNRQYFLSNIFLMKQPDSTFTALVSIYSKNSNLKIAEEGLAHDLIEEAKRYLPLISHKTNSKNGQIFLINFNPVAGSTNKKVL